MTRQNRKYQRRHLIYYLKVVQPATGETIGRLVDITPVGMMIIGDQPMELDLILPLRLILPADPGQECNLDLLGETVWCHRDVNPDFYATGFRFLNPSDETSRTIQDLVDTWGFQD